MDRQYQNVPGVFMNGLRPRRFKDSRRFSFPRTFGAVSRIDYNFNVDPGLSMPNQNVPDPYWGRPALPNGCTGFGTSDIATTEDRILYDPESTYRWTLMIQGGKEGDTCTLQDSFKSATVYGVRAKGETDEQALVHRRSPYFEIERHDGLDWFDSIISAVKINAKPVSLGTPWLPQWELVGKDGKITYAPSGKNFQIWHDWNATGAETIDGIPYLIGKSWQGSEYGDGGFVYFPREIINVLMSIKGTDALTNAKARPGDIQAVKLNIIEVLLSYMYRLLAA